MANANDVLKIAAGEIGYVALNDPKNGSKYGRWLAELLKQSWLAGPSTTVPWCAIFVSWVFFTAGVSVPGMPTAACGNIREANRNTSRHIKNKYDAQPGDIVLFRWDGKVNNFDYSDHVGIVEKNCGSYVQTIEGNTSSSNAGSQGNGGGVWRRTRSWGNIQMVIRPVYGAPTVVKKNMNDAKIADIPNQVYTGKEIKPNITSGAGATFDVSYDNNINIGYGIVTATGNGNWTGSVSKLFKILPEQLVKFTDVDPTAWYVNTLAKAVELGYINGYSGTSLIDPNGNLTRGQACCMIANAEGAKLDSAFSDVIASPYYYEAVNWAEENEIVNGKDGAFRPDDPCTRQEFCCMLYNLAGNPDPAGEPTRYSDWNSVADWARDAVAWCVEVDVLSGDVGMIRPNDNCLRCEAAALLVNYKNLT